MKLKALVILGFAAFFSVSLAGASLASGGASSEPKAKLEQKLPGNDVVIPSIDEKWGPVKFTHQAHLAYSACTYCHHTNKDLTLESFNAGKVEKVPLCAECHARKEGEAKTPKNADGTELWSKEAYHVNCIDCHKGEITRKPKDSGAVTKQGEGPTKCAACHEVK